MNKDNNKHPYKDRKFDVVAYDSSWPRQFEAYASKIGKIYGDARIEHIGSTSVPGMSGKPCIDVLVVVPDMQRVESHIREMEDAGFEYAGQFVMENSRLFRIMKENELIANIHFFPAAHPQVAEMLNLRDYLRGHPDEVAAYSNTKKELHEKYADDYASYRKHKDEYMAALKGRASDALGGKASG